MTRWQHWHRVLQSVWHPAGRTYCSSCILDQFLNGASRCKPQHCWAHPVLAFCRSPCQSTCISYPWLPSDSSIFPLSRRRQPCFLRTCVSPELESPDSYIGAQLLAVSPEPDHTPRHCPQADHWPWKPAGSRRRLCPWCAQLRQPIVLKDQGKMAGGSQRCRQGVGFCSGSAPAAGATDTPNTPPAPATCCLFSALRSLPLVCASPPCCCSLSAPCCRTWVPAPGCHMLALPPRCCPTQALPARCCRTRARASARRCCRTRARASHPPRPWRTRAPASHTRDLGCRCCLTRGCSR